MEGSSIETQEIARRLETLRLEYDRILKGVREGRTGQVHFDKDQDPQKQSRPELVPPPESQTVSGRGARSAAALIQAPATTALIVVNIYVFLLMVRDFLILAAHEPSGDWATGFLVTWGGNLGRLALDGEAWRLVTGMFLHAGPMHIAANMICLWFWGRVTERALGTVRFLLAYFGSGVLANLAGAWVHPDVVSVGASGAMAGTLGLMVVIWSKGDARVSAKSVVGNIIFNAALSLQPRVDWVAHLAGFAAGLGFGSLLFPASFVHKPPEPAEPLREPPKSISFQEPMNFPKGTVVYRTGMRLVAILPDWTLIADDGAGGEVFATARDYRDKTGDDGEWRWIREFR
jgi:membrane associated rhomboid family serine protease